MTAEERVSFRELTATIEAFRAEVKADMSALDSKLEASVQAAANVATLAVQTAANVKSALEAHQDVEKALRDARTPWENGFRSLLFTLLGMGIAAIAGGLWMHMVHIAP